MADLRRGQDESQRFDIGAHRGHNVFYKSFQHGGGVAAHFKQHFDAARHRIGSVGSQNQMAYGGHHIVFAVQHFPGAAADRFRSEEHTSELQSLMRTSYAV